MPTLEDRVPEILRSLPTRISDVLIPWSQRSPDRPALVESSGTWTYGQLASVIAETRSWLVESGMRPGDRIMLVCENCRALVAVLLAVAGLDAWPVLVNARLSARDLHHERVAACEGACRAPRRTYLRGRGAGSDRHRPAERDSRA